MNGLSEDDTFSELFQPMVQLPEHLVGAKGFFGGTFNVEDSSNGQVSGDLQQGSHAITQFLYSTARYSKILALYMCLLTKVFIILNNQAVAKEMAEWIDKIQGLPRRWLLHLDNFSHPA